MSSTLLIIPFDILSIIVNHLDLDTLKAFSLISREYNYEANKYLWYSISIRIRLPDETGVISQRCNAILRDRTRARHIRTLFLFINTISLEDIGKHLQPIREVLGVLPNLFSLRVSSINDVRPEVIEHLLITDIPARLRAFCFSVPPLLQRQKAFVEFLRSQPRIRSLHSRDCSYDEFSNLPSDVLPQLESISAWNPEAASQFICGRPVHTLHINKACGALDTHHIIQTITASSAPIRTIHLLITGHQSIALLAPHLRHLRTFGIRALLPWTPDPPTNQHVQVATALALYPELEEVQLQGRLYYMKDGADIREGLAGELFRRCKRLQRVVMVMGLTQEHIQTEIFERTDGYVENSETRWANVHSSRRERRSGPVGSSWLSGVIYIDW